MIALPVWASILFSTLAGNIVAVETLLNNRYAISDSGADPLGKGGMAVIYAGTDTETGEEIAAKTLLPAFQGDTHRRERFRREARVLRDVQNPHIVELIDVVDGRHGSWILMEHLHGQTLQDKLAEEGAFRPSTVNTWLAQICAALEHMHRLNYVHLDVTPQNIFLTTTGEVKLIDFGIAQRAYVVPQREGNKLLGTAAYISPEHGSGRIVKPTADVYSLGCVVFELLTNKKVFSEHGQVANDATITMRQENAPDLPTSVAPELDLPAWVDRVVGRALVPTPDDRYPSVTAFAEEFNAHANPPLIRLSWPKRQPDRVSETVRVGAGLPVPLQENRPLVTETPNRVMKVPSAPRRWLQREVRNARKALVVFALLISMVLGAPLIGGAMMMDWLLGAVPGSTTQVIDGDWNMRASPAADGEIRALLVQGTSVRITGAPTVVRGDLWWPVSATIDDQRTSGWAHDSGLKRTWIMDRAARLQMLRQGIDDRWDTATSLLPG